MPEITAPVVTGPEMIATLVHVSRYTVSCLPRSHPLAVHFTLAVAETVPGRWTITNLFGECLSADSRWDPYLTPSLRPDGWDLTHRFDLPAALRLAKAEAPRLTANGVTVTEALARIAAAHPTAAVTGKADR